MTEKRYFIDDEFPSATWDDLMGLTPWGARRILNDEEYEQWCKDREALFERKRIEQEEYSRTHYFPGCYGDPLMDCN